MSDFPTLQALDSNHVFRLFLRGGPFCESAHAPKPYSLESRTGVIIQRIEGQDALPVR
ncbi:hypothetical protein [Adlercreutzia sp. ZJ141]|uniref:hypothetical protein n=1 Tax=Adlercreutzia sp. ZJ141 TaxID=2709406 RepID=UPI0013EA20D0|nr:hypothetical protein [Adlercreutzia sp. ZJ141]